MPVPQGQQRATFYSRFARGSSHIVYFQRSSGEHGSERGRKRIAGETPTSLIRRDRIDAGFTLLF